MGGDGEWTDDDRAKVLAWKIEQSKKCPNCGVFEWQHEHVEADLWRCGTCADMQRVRDEVKNSPSADDYGLRIGLFPKEGD